MFSKPKVPPPPPAPEAPPPPPNAPRPAEAVSQQAISPGRGSRRIGAASLIATGPRGLRSRATTTKRSLIGGSS